MCRTGRKARIWLIAGLACMAGSLCGPAQASAAPLINVKLNLSGVAKAVKQVTAKLPDPGARGRHEVGPVPTTGKPFGDALQLTGGVFNLLKGEIGVGTLLESATCPLAQGLTRGASWPALLEPVGSVAVTAACVSHFLDFEWRTTWTGAGGRRRSARAITTVGVPTPLQMDDDPAPDVLGLVFPRGINDYAIQFTRLDPVGRLEGTADIVISDPTGDLFTSEKIAAGIDSNGGRFPSSIQLALLLRNLSLTGWRGDDTDLGISITSASQSERVGIYTDLFSDGPRRQAPRSAIRADVGFAPLPASVKADLVMRASGGMNARITSAQRTTTDLAVEIEDSSDPSGTLVHQTMEGRLEGMAKKTEVDYEPITDSALLDGTQLSDDFAGQVIRYEASSELPRVDFRYETEQTPPGGVTSPLLHADATVTGVPTELGIESISSVEEEPPAQEEEQAPEAALELTTGAGAIGRAEVEFALEHEPVSLNTARSGFRYHGEPEEEDGSTPMAVAARIDGVDSAHYDSLAGGLDADVRFTAPQPLDAEVRDEESGTSLTAAMESLPSTAKVSYVPATSATGGELLTVDYSTGQESIALTTAEVVWDEPLAAGLVKEAQARIADLAPGIAVRMDQDAQTSSFEATEPIGLLEFAARDEQAAEQDLTPPLSDGATGVSAVMRDGGPVAVIARLQGLKAVTADMAAQRYRFEAGPVPLEIRAQVDEPREREGQPRKVLGRELLATIDRLPAWIELDMNRDEATATHVPPIVYTAETGGQDIFISLTGDELYEKVPEVDRVEAEIVDVPQTLSATIDPSSKLDVTASGGIGSMRALGTSGPDPDLPADEHAVDAGADGTDLWAEAQFLDFSGATYTPDPISATLTTSEPHAFDLAAEYTDGDGTTTASARIEDVPDRLTFTVDEGDEETVATYDASAKISSEVTVSGALLASAHQDVETAHASIDQITSKLTARWGADGSLSVDALEGVEKVAMEVTSGEPVPALTDGAHAAYAEVHGDTLIGAGQFLDFTHASFAPDPLTVALHTTEDHPLEVDAHADLDGDRDPEATATVDVVDVPAEMSFSMADDGSYSYEASRDITSIAARASGLPDLPGDLATASMTITGVARFIEGSYGADGDFRFSSRSHPGVHAPLDPVDSIVAEAANADGPAFDPAWLGTPSHVLALERDGEVRGRVKLAGVAEIETSEGLEFRVASDVLQSLDVHAGALDSGGSATNRDDFSDYARLALRSGVDDTRVTLAEDERGNGVYEIENNGEIEDVELELSSKKLPNGVADVDVTIEGVPEVARITVPDEADAGGAAFFERKDDGTLEPDGIDLIEASVNDGQATWNDGNDGVAASLDDSGDVDQAFFEYEGFQSFSYEITPERGTIALANQTTPEPFVVDFEARQFLLDARLVIDAPPRALSLRIEGDTIRYDGSDEIDSISIDAEVLDTASVRGAITEVPKTMELCLGMATLATCIPPHNYGAEFGGEEYRVFSIGAHGSGDFQLDFDRIEYAAHISLPLIHIATVDFPLHIGVPEKLDWDVGVQRRDTGSSKTVLDIWQYADTDGGAATIDMDMELLGIVKLDLDVDLDTPGFYRANKLKVTVDEVENRTTWMGRGTCRQEADIDVFGIDFFDVDLCHFSPFEGEGGFPDVALTTPRSGTFGTPTDGRIRGTAATKALDERRVEVEIRGDHNGNGSDETLQERFVAVGTDGRWATSAIDFEYREDERYFVIARQRNAEGEVDSTEASFIYDSEGPGVTIEDPEDGSRIRTDRPDVSGKAQKRRPDDEVLVQFFSGTSATGTPVFEDTAHVAEGSRYVYDMQSQTSTTLDDGTYTVKVSQTDLAGNLGFATSTFTIDHDPPAVTITEPADGSASADGSPAVAGVAGTADGDRDEVAVRLLQQDPDDLTFGVIATRTAAVAAGDGSFGLDPISENALGDGSYRVEVTQRDGAGHSTTARSDFTISGAPAPGVVITGPSEGSRTNDDPIALTGTGELDGEVTLRVYSGTDTAATPIFEQQVTPDADGDFAGEVALPDEGTYTLTASGRVSGVERRASSTFVVDRTGPVVTILEPVDGSTITEQRPALRVQAGTADGDADTLSGSFEREQGSNWALHRLFTDGSLNDDGSFVRDPWAGEDLGFGRHRFQVTQTDSAGNSTTATSIFTVASP